MTNGTKVRRVPTRIAALDRLLGGGLAAGHVTLLEGAPATGKTTLIRTIAKRVARRKRLHVVDKRRGLTGPTLATPFSVACQLLTLAPRPELVLIDVDGIGSRVARQELVDLARASGCAVLIIDYPGDLHDLRRWPHHDCAAVVKITRREDVVTLDTTTKNRYGAPGTCDVKLRFPQLVSTKKRNSA